MAVKWRMCCHHLYSWHFEGERFDARIGQSVTLHELHLGDVTAALGEERQRLMQPLRRVWCQLEHERSLLTQLIRQDITLTLWTDNNTSLQSIHHLRELHLVRTLEDTYLRVCLHVPTPFPSSSPSNFNIVLMV